jgi:predicted CXXCH cytochrome family protein
MGKKSRNKKSNQSSPIEQEPREDNFPIFVPVIFALVATFTVWGIFLRKPTTTETSSPQTKIEADAAIYSKYAGSQSCRDCHSEQFKNWEGSHHGLAERAIDIKRDALSPAAQQPFKHGSQTSQAKMVNGSIEIITQALEGGQKSFTAARVIGESPLRQFLIPTQDGRFQSTEIAYDPHHGDWFNIFGNEDRQPGEWGHWTGRGMNWNSRCAACHNTRLQKHYDEPTDSYHTTMAEMSVGCESCHGPMADHAKWQKDSSNKGKDDPTIQKFSDEQVLSTCGTCHSRRAELTGNFQPGDLFEDHYSLMIPDATETYYPDGQVHHENYEYTSFLSSRMHSLGVTCLDCHEPHSGKTRAAGNDLCLRCHQNKIESIRHSHHKADSPGNQCVSCHMPLTTYMGRHARRDHGFTIPDPSLTKEFGIPNACNRCHTDQSADWALKAVDKWHPGELNRHTQNRARTIAQARAGEKVALPKLLSIARDEKEYPVWKASALSLLKPWAHERDVGPTLIKNAQDPEPLVRTMAARSLEGITSSNPAALDTLYQLLNDPVRAVRVEAAWSLRSQGNPTSTAGMDLQKFLKNNADQPVGALQLGVYHQDRGEMEQAMKYFKRAVQWDPHSAALHQALAFAYNKQGNREAAIQSLEEACRVEPKQAEYRFNLALAFAETQQTDKVIEHLEQTVKLDPKFSRAWYNLGLAYNGQEKTKEALAALLRAETSEPDNPDYPYARATILLRHGRLPEARAAVEKALKIDPLHANANGLRKALHADRKK